MKHQLSLVSCLLLAAPAIPSAAELRIDLISGYAFEAGDAANGDSLPAQATPDGRYLALSSEAVNLVPGFADHNGVQDALVLDRQSGLFDYVSLAAGEARTGGRASTAVSLSDDGRWVLFASTARDLIAGATYPGALTEEQLYLFDRVARSTQLVSHAPGNPLLAGDQSATGIRLSADGRFALFESDARNLVSPPAATGTRQVYFFDRESGAVRLVTHKALEPNTLANGLSDAIDMSADGGVVLFESRATDLELGYTDDDPVDVFVWDRVADTYQLISRLAADATATTGGGARDISADGRFVLIDSIEIGIAAGVTDGNGAAGTDVFVVDRQSGTARLASPAAAAATVSANGSSFGYRLSDDGRYVYLESAAQNLVSPFTDGNGSSVRDLYVFDSGSGAVTLVSHAAADTARGANGRMYPLLAPQAISPDGHYALYETLATDLQSGVTDTNGALDLYLYDRAAGVSSLVSRRGAGLEAGALERYSGRTIAGGETFFASLAPLDPAVADPQPQLDVYHFDSGASSMVTRAAVDGVSPWPGGSGGNGVLTPNGRFAAFTDFVWDRQGSGFAERVSHAAGQPAVAGNFPSAATAITPDGRFVLLDSRATDLAAGVTDTNNQQDVFFYDRNVDTAFLVSHAAGQPAVAASGGSLSRVGGWLSPDARQAVLHSTATNLVPGQAGTPSSFDNLFFHDRPSGTTALISHHHASPTHATENGSYLQDISDDGRYLVFESGSHDLISGFVDGNDYFTDDFGLVHLRDLYFYDRVTRFTTLISHRPGQSSHGELEASPEKAWLSADATAVYYTSLRLTETEVGPAKVYRWDRTTNLNTLVTQVGGSPLSPCGDDAQLEDMTPDGRLLLITTSCAFVAGDINGAADVYLIDRQAGTKALISHPAGQPGLAAGGSGEDLSVDGRRVVYRDATGAPHSYDRFRQEAARLTPAHFDPALGVPATVLGASDDGSRVLVVTREPGLHPFDGNGTFDLFLITLGDLFADGFESGSTAAWSLSLP